MIKYKFITNYVKNTYIYIFIYIHISQKPKGLEGGKTLPMLI